jgi:hypothetical protein
MSLGIKIGIAYYDERGSIHEWRTDGDEPLEQVTHWMSLPELPPDL